MGRVHDGTVGVADADRVGGRAFVDDVGGDCAEMRRAAAVGDRKRIR